ncbi:SDR family NAD(P)-dependent oxidoreductase [Streptococcus caprae]|uniref:SDR family NAD(P)-dependent oxidoreductase n=1 Tax=Streptococcus caprae TaxID=1640501 RepID=A0ABV8CYG0_9STRE
MTEVKERVTLITGATGGIAQELIKLVPETDHLILVGRSKTKLEDLYGQLGHATLVALDITDDEAVAELVDSVYDKFGRIDILVNNAGYAIYKEAEAFAMAEIRDMFNVNTLASINFCRLVAGRMKQSGSGHIINIVSMSGYVATAKSSIYSATKYAMIGYSDTLRLEMAEHGVYVTTINPGPVSTGFFDLADPDGSYQKSVKAFTLSPEVVAQRIYRIFGQNKRNLNMPCILSATHKFYTLFPRLSDWFARNLFNLK